MEAAFSMERGACGEKETKHSVPYRTAFVPLPAGDTVFEAVPLYHKQSGKRTQSGSMISVIVPVFHGRGYIKDIIGMVERNAACVDGPVELVFVNDSPEETIDDVCIGRGISVLLFDNDQNRGIHYSRARGIRNSHGEYLLILDQDDRISDYFLISQMEKIGKADMIVANGYEELSEGKRILYRYALMQWTVKHGIFYTVFGSRILSPGQCLLRRESIPELWFRTMIQNNGADDYLLWIYMLWKRSRIRINRERLYVHRFTGDNASGDWKEMEASLREVICVALKNHALSITAYHYIAGGMKEKQTVLRRIAGRIVRIGNAVNRKV